MIKIYHPIWKKENCAYFSLSKWNLDKEKGDEVLVEVYDGNKAIGHGTISKKQWIRTAKQKEKKVVFRPDDPMIYYYNTMNFKQKLSPEEESLRMIKEGII